MKTVRTSVVPVQDLISMHLRLWM